MVAYVWTCSCCGRAFDELPTCWSVGQAPASVYAIPEGQRDARVLMNADLCVIDDENFFIRGHVEIPVIGSATPFIWNVWSSLSRTSYDVMIGAWEDEDRERQGPFFGWLNSDLPYEPNTLALKTNVHVRPRGTVPFFEIEPTDHPLAVEQRTGVTIERVVEIAELFLPKH
ncbi:MAG TPA: DUF2199 domain-containing protein [Hansschlegelia sp.]